MTRSELEALIWQNWPTRGPEAVAAVDAILAGADAYGLAEYGLAAERRAELDEASRRADRRIRRGP